VDEEKSAVGIGWATVEMFEPPTPASDHSLHLDLNDEGYSGSPVTSRRGADVGGQGGPAAATAAGRHRVVVWPPPSSVAARRRDTAQGLNSPYAARRRRPSLPGAVACAKGAPVAAHSGSDPPGQTCTHSGHVRRMLGLHRGAEDWHDVGSRPGGPHRVNSPPAHIWSADRDPTLAGEPPLPQASMSPVGADEPGHEAPVLPDEVLPAILRAKVHAGAITAVEADHILQVTQLGHAAVDVDDLSPPASPLPPAPPPPAATPAPCREPTRPRVAQSSSWVVSGKHFLCACDKPLGSGQYRRRTLDESRDSLLDNDSGDEDEGFDHDSGSGSTAAVRANSLCHSTALILPTAATSLRDVFDELRPRPRGRRSLKECLLWGLPRGQVTARQVTVAAAAVSGGADGVPGSYKDTATTDDYGEPCLTSLPQPEPGWARTSRPSVAGLRPRSATFPQGRPPDTDTGNRVSGWCILRDGAVEVPLVDVVHF